MSLLIERRLTAAAHRMIGREAIGVVQHVTVKGFGVKR
jgi:hypothetical protein